MGSIEKRTIEAKSKLQVGLPIIKPNTKLVDALKNICSTEKNVNSCYLFMKGVEQKETPLLTLGVLFNILDKDSVNVVMQKIINVLQTYLSDNQQIDLMILNNQPHIIELLRKYKGATIFAQ